MARIECPACKNKKIELVWESHSSYDTEYIREYICKCGCHFEATFELKEIKKILDALR